MNREQIERFVMRYLETTGCRVLEKSPAHVTVKFSPEADKDLTGRPYYWSFVERTGAEPETISFTFVFDPEGMDNSSAGGRGGSGNASAPAGAAGTQTAGAGSGASSGASGNHTDRTGSDAHAGTGGNQADETPPSPATAASDSILARFFGVGSAPGAGGFGRIPKDVVTYGSRKLEQLFGVVQSKGRFVRLFEEPKQEKRNPYASIGYSTWLGINFKVEFVCDVKRDELHSLGIHFGTGQITERFYDLIKDRNMTPKLPSNIHLQPVQLSLSSAVESLEQHLEQTVKQYDHRWAEEAHSRLSDELQRIHSYYEELLRTIEEDKKSEVEEQYRNREKEIEWQYRPRVLVSVINCGFFHLAEGLRSPIDGYR